jgi:hypothetical protein
MDIRAWEDRASAMAGAGYGSGHGYQDEDDDYYDQDKTMALAEYEEMLFRRVLDKIRIARAAGNADVQLSSEELDAYQAKLYGTTTAAARSQQQLRPSNASTNHVANAGGVDTTGKSRESSSRSKKSQQRNSVFGSKPKKEKSSSRKQTSSHAPPPGFVVPGPDGQPIYAPITPYQGNLSRDSDPRPASRSASDTNHTPTPPRSTPPQEREMLGAYPASEISYAPSSPLGQGRQVSSRETAYERDVPPVSRTRSSSIQSKLTPFPVEPYQYHTFTPSPSSPTSPQPQYTRRVSSVPSEASYTSVSRRVPAPPVSHQHLPAQPDPAPIPQASASATPVVVAETAAKASGSGRDGEARERRRKSGKSRKKG